MNNPAYCEWSEHVSPCFPEYYKRRSKKDKSKGVLSYALLHAEVDDASFGNTFYSVHTWKTSKTISASSFIIKGLQNATHP